MAASSQPLGLGGNIYDDESLSPWEGGGGWVTKARHVWLSATYFRHTAQVLHISCCFAFLPQPDRSVGKVTSYRLEAMLTY